MQDLAPGIVRQRLLIEAYYTIDVQESTVREYLLGLAVRLDLRAYGEPVVFAPSSGMGREDNAGFDAFMPLIDSGISLYVWSAARFFSTVLYTCKGFDEADALAFTREYFSVSGAMESMSF